MVLWLLCLQCFSFAADRPAPGEPSTLAEREAAWQRHRELEQSSLLGGLEWRSVGPVVQGGRVVDIESVPGEPFTFYVAYASGGLWRTENNGHSFEPIFDDQPTIIMGDLALDPSNSKNLWVGTGENNSSRSSYGGYGVFRSEDGGESWRHVGLGESESTPERFMTRNKRSVACPPIWKPILPPSRRNIAGAPQASSKS